VTFTGGKPTIVTMFEPPMQSPSVSTVFSRVMGGTTVSVAVEVSLTAGSIGSTLAVTVATLVMLVLAITGLEHGIWLPNGGISKEGGSVNGPS
jgi:hypothetical protein